MEKQNFYSFPLHEKIRKFSIFIWAMFWVKVVATFVMGDSNDISLQHNILLERGRSESTVPRAHLVEKKNPSHPIHDISTAEYRPLKFHNK